MHSYILFFTTVGKVYWIKVHELPQASRAARGRPIVNLLNLEPGEKVSAFLTVREFQEGRYIIFATKNGLIKKTELMAYSNPRPSGIRAIGLEDGDEVIDVRLTDGQQELILSTAEGSRFVSKKNRFVPPGAAPSASSACASIEAITSSAWRFSRVASMCSPWLTAASANAPIWTSTGCSRAVARASSR